MDSSARVRNALLTALGVLGARRARRGRLARVDAVGRGAARAGRSDTLVDILFSLYIVC